MFLLGCVFIDFFHLDFFFFFFYYSYFFFFFFFFQAEDGIRDADVTGVQTCALPIYILFSRSVRVISPFKYFSIIKEAIGPAQVAPKPPFSIKTATTIFGFSFGANARNTEWSLSFTLSPFTVAEFSTVPVFPQILMPGI